MSSALKIARRYKDISGSESRKQLENASATRNDR